MFALAPGSCAEGSGALVGRNYDWAIADLQWCELHRYIPASGPRRIAYTHHWAGCTDILNEAGLYMAIASLPPEPVRGAGVQWSIIADIVGERCSTVRDAVSVIATCRHLRPMSYLLADADGDVAVVEATPSSAHLRRGDHGYVVAANVKLEGLLLKDFAAQPVAAGIPRPSSRAHGEPSELRASARVERVREMLNAALPCISLADVRAVLTDHQAPICTGEHGPGRPGRWGTIWSGICMPAKGEFQIAPGPPCRTDYRAFSIY
jgi:hypothetical protein